jgi:hypothetical protein
MFRFIIGTLFFITTAYSTNLLSVCLSFDLLYRILLRERIVQYGRRTANHVSRTRWKIDRALIFFPHEHVFCAHQRRTKSQLGDDGRDTSHPSIHTFDGLLKPSFNQVLEYTTN